MTATRKAIIISAIGLLFIGTASIAALLINSHKEAITSQPTSSVVAPVTQPPTVSELLKLVNEERNRAGVAPLIIDERLNQSAQLKADEMVKDNNNSHVDASGKHGYSYINDLNISCTTASENLFWGNTTEYPSSSAGAVKWWMSSKLHHDAMLNSNYTTTGFAVNGYRIVEHFCQAR